MGQRKSLNERRLTKKQVQDLIKSEGRLHDEYTKESKETYASGYIKQDLVYELPNDRILFVFDPNGTLLAGKGDIYPKDYFAKSVKWHKRVKDDYANNRGSSVDHWRFYSKYQSNLINQVDRLISELADKLQIDIKQLDKSYKSLDIVSIQTELYDIDKALTDIYDNLVAYVGEVIRKKVNGQWKISIDYDGDCPYIDIGINDVMYMPINIVWENLQGLDAVDFRKSVGNEARQVGFRHGKKIKQKEIR
ncbi:hypothetical protein DR864_16240 [Runella rosea]|uniref:Uncharacterized protein n=1 Tax=Runella rosea TaxID=2259595 RepID=A0A344TKL9_9BACT|nr:hypothetical protein [Runella rosea]AXE19190.1 hypothetical protein DR864_16240 [Runella rosea]